MRNLTKRTAALALALGLTLGLTACGGSGLNKFDATTYVEGLLKETYLGEFDDAYMKLVGIDETEAEETYDAGLDTEVDYFIYRYGIEYPTDEFRADLKELYAEIYKHSKFKVISAAEQDDGSFSVKVEVEPINIAQLAEEDMEEGLEPFYEKYPAEVQDAMSDEEYEAMDQEWAQALFGFYNDNLADIGNLEAQSTVVQLEKDDDGYYSITDDSFSNLDALIISYPQ